MGLPAVLIDACRFAWRILCRLLGLISGFVAILLIVLVCQTLPEPPSPSMFAMAVLGALMALLFFRTLPHVGETGGQSKRMAGLVALPCLFFTVFLFARIDRYGWEVWPTSVVLSVAAWCSWIIIIGSMPLVLAKIAEPSGEPEPPSTRGVKS